MDIKWLLCLIFGGEEQNVKAERFLKNRRKTRPWTLTASVKSNKSVGIPVTLIVLNIKNSEINQIEKRKTSIQA